MRKHARKAVVGVALGLAMVLATASTAGAVWSAPWYLTDPTKLVIGTTEFDFGDPTETDCTEPLPDQALGIDMQGDDEEGTWTATGAVWDDVEEEWVPGPIKARFRVPDINRLFQADISLLSATGTYTAGAANHDHPNDPPHPPNEPNYDFATTGNHVTAQVRVYELVEPDCEKDDLVCTLNVRLVSTSGYGYIFDAPNHTPPGDWVQMQLTTEAPGGIRPVAVGGSCDTDIAGFAVNQPVSFDPLTGLDP